MSLTLNSQSLSHGDLAAATGSLRRVLKGVPGVLVSRGAGGIIVTLQASADALDREKLRVLAAGGWESWNVHVVHEAMKDEPPCL